MSMPEVLRFILSVVCTLCGLAAILSAVFGVFRFHHALQRIHAAALIDTAGMLFMLAGVMLAMGLDVAVLKLLAVICFLWITSPVSSHLIARL